MNRKIGLVLFIFFCFLIWLYFAIYESSINNWWTVNQIKQRTEDTVQVGVSIVRGIVGALIFTFSGTLIYLVIRTRN